MDNSAEGGLRKIAKEHYDEQNESLVIRSDDAAMFCASYNATPTLGRTCGQLHPGFCKHDHKDISVAVRAAVGVLHSVRRYFHICAHASKAFVV
jgi:hypothetical protein